MCAKDTVRESKNESCIILLSACRQLVIIFMSSTNVAVVVFVFYFFACFAFHHAFHLSVDNTQEKKNQFLKLLFLFHIAVCCGIHLFNWKNWLWHPEKGIACMIFEMIAWCQFSMKKYKLKMIMSNLACRQSGKVFNILNTWITIE